MQPKNLLIFLRYGYDTIAGHAVGVSGNNGGISVADKQHNADSYAILGCGKSGLMVRS